MFGGGVRVLATHSICQFPLHFPSRPSPCATRFRMSSTKSHCAPTADNECIQRVPCILIQIHFSYLLTPWSRVLEKLTNLQLVKKFPAFYGTRMFITTFTSVCHLSLSRASLIQSIPPTSHFRKIHLNILPSMPGSPKWSLSLRFTHQNPEDASPVSHMHYMPRPSHSSRFYHPNNIV